MHSKDNGGRGHEGSVCGHSVYSTAALRTPWLQSSRPQRQRHQQQRSQRTHAVLLANTVNSTPAKDRIAVAIPEASALYCPVHVAYRLGNARCASSEKDTV